MIKNPEFVQTYWSKTAEGIFKNGHDRFRLMKRLAYFDRSFYENINYYDLMGSICTNIREVL